ncbi:hypothetical protein FK216_10985 [Moraxellaceae bacterium AER2_44_116]|nr:hypothetical protein [Moraxellaceae bacterium]TQC96774.1 hypothetical protein FK216_10985 [Moraxellaceae bacterium AER2_44_116]
MSSNFSWFLRFIIYIPLFVCVTFITLYVYLTGAFDRNIDACLKDPAIVPSVTDRKKMIPFVGCLKRKSNFFLTQAMDENRLYQYAYPKVPCNFVGKWHVSSEGNTYWLTITKDALFSMEMIKYGKEAKDEPHPVRTGVWSSVNPYVAIQFFDDTFFWPLNQSKVEWTTANKFVMHNGFQQVFYFNRNSVLDQTCVFKR